jgi:streptogramin lyase
MRRSIGTIDAGDDAVWVTNPNEGTVTRMDPVTNRVAATIRIAKAYPVDVVTGNGAVWVVSDQQVLWMFKINPRTNTVTARIPLPGSPDSVRPSRWAPGACGSCRSRNRPWFGSTWRRIVALP